jgi:hypothetical protein
LFGADIKKEYNNIKYEQKWIGRDYGSNFLEKIKPKVMNFVNVRRIVAAKHNRRQFLWK